MINVKLCDWNVHRNETTFRQFINNADLFREVGINFMDGDSYDFLWIAQASITDKTLPLKESVEKGCEYLSKINGDYMIIDGQDSTGLMGTIDVFRESEALLFLKNSYLKDFDLYKQGWVNGRIYWGDGDYSVSDIDKLKPKMKLTGTNWVGTINPTWQQYNSNKIYDVSCMFSWGDKKNYEYTNLTSTYYDDHRRILLEKLEKTDFKVVRREAGKRIPQQQFYQNMYDSKITTAPIGYGETAVRDIEAAMLGSVLLKPDMSYIDTKPFIYEDGVTYVACKYDWSDVEEKIEWILKNYEELQPHLTENMRKRFVEGYTSENLVRHIYDIFVNLNGVGV